MENKEYKGYLQVDGNVNMFCPHCGSVLWNELPHGDTCEICKGKISLRKKDRKKVAIEYITTL